MDSTVEIEGIPKEDIEFIYMNNRCKKSGTNIQTKIFAF